jgi:hypothetical protein
VAENVGSGVRVATRRDELSQVGEVVASSDEWQLARAVGPDLRQTRSGREAVADALSANGMFGGATLTDIVFEGLGGATVANGAIRFAVKMPQITKVANATAALVVGGVGESVLELGHFEGEASGRGRRVGEDASLGGATQGDGLLFEFVQDARFIAECEGSADLNTRSAQLESIGEFAGMAITASKPEGQAESADFLQLRNITRAVEGLSNGS